MSETTTTPTRRISEIENDLTRESFDDLTRQAAALIDFMVRCGQHKSPDIQDRIESRILGMMTSNERACHIAKDRALEIAVDACNLCGHPEIYA